MNNYHEIDMTSWVRSKNFEFYQSFDAPCFNISIKLEANPIYTEAKKQGESFFLMVLYAILRAANQVPAMRQRVIDGKPVEFEKIAIMTPIMTPSELFEQIWCEYEDNFFRFKKSVQPLIEAAKNGTPKTLLFDGEDFLCASCSPWLHFESITQAEYRFSQAVPILAWGKIKDGLIPISLKVSHSFMDGLGCAKFFGALEELLANPKMLYEDQKL